jgi:methylenetetrahydrofolate dehydrogenase (NADP+)/methenyltetrahydrofolate cyclohydrolase
MRVIDGKAIAESILVEIEQEVAKIAGLIRPKIVFIRVGEDPASIAYVRMKQKMASRLGFESQLSVFPESISEKELIQEVESLNENRGVHGILVQAPLPKHMNSCRVFNAVCMEKDVDGFNSANLGKLCQEDASGFVACTPAGIVELLRHSGVSVEGKRVVILGRSLIVGKPMALLMMRKQGWGNATVTVCHSQSKNLKAITREAEVLIVAMGKAGFVTEDMVNEDAVVIDVGVNRVGDARCQEGYRLVGDVDFENVAKKVKMITPVPGGVGPMTVAMLMRNTLKAFYQITQQVTQ